MDIRTVVDYTRFHVAKERALDIVDMNVGYFERSLPSGSARNGKYVKVERNEEWTTGFWTGILAIAYEMSHDPIYKRAFEEVFPSFLERLKDEERVQTHDLGFIYVLSMVPAERVFGMETSDSLVEAARKLLRRFHEKPGYIQAWRSLNDPQERKRTIIDSMMNLPLLYKAWKITGDETFKDVAVKHARTCMEYLVREDFSTYHTFLFDPETGEPIGPETVQGHSDDSFWARGQAWAVYGFTLSYIYTGIEDFLKTAVGTAEFMIERLPEDLVPVWDMVFDEESGEERDSSAASIFATALLDLSRLVDRDRSHFYQVLSVSVLSSLTRDYLNWRGGEGEPIILHGVHAKPMGTGVDEGNIWGDFFYLEALMKLFNPRWRSYWIEEMGR